MGHNVYVRLIDKNSLSCYLKCAESRIAPNITIYDTIQEILVDFRFFLEKTKDLISWDQTSCFVEIPGSVESTFKKKWLYQEES